MSSTGATASTREGTSAPYGNSALLAVPSHNASNINGKFFEESDTAEDVDAVSLLNIFVGGIESIILQGGVAATP